MEIRKTSSNAVAPARSSSVSGANHERKVSKNSVTPSGNYRQGVVTHTETHEGPEHVVREYSNYTENVVRRKRMVEETIEKTIVVPETVMREEEYDEVEIVKENIIEVAKPIIKEVFVEVPEYEHVEEIIEVEEKRVEEKVVHVDKVEYQEVINYVPRIERKEIFVDVDQTEYVEVEVERVVEVPEYREEVVIVEKPVPRYVEKVVNKNVDVEVEQLVERSVPVPVEQVVEQTFHLPAIKTSYKVVKIPVYTPRFIEIPVPAEMLTEKSLTEAQDLIARIKQVSTIDYPSLCEIEELAAEAKSFQLQVEENPTIRFQTLANHLDTNAVVLNTGMGDVVGRKISVTVSTHQHELQHQVVNP